MNDNVLIAAEKPSRSPGLGGGIPWSLCAVLLFALLIRGGALLVMPNALRVDTDGYRRLAENLVAHGTLGVGDAPSAYRAPLYPLLLAGCLALDDAGRLAIGVLHVVLGLATVGLVWVLGATLGWSPPTPPHCNGGALPGDTKPLRAGFPDFTAVLAALLVALDPILLAQSALVMTETLAAFLTTAGLVTLTWAGCRPTACRAMLAGGTLGLGVLCRPTLLPWIVLVAIVLWLRGPGATAGLSSSARNTVGQANRRPRHSLTLPAAFLLGVLIVLSPWAIRNQLQFGRPIVTTTHGGYTLLVANNPEFYQWLGTGAWGGVWRADRFNADWYQRRPHDELQADRQAYAEAWQNIREAPGTFSYACAVRLGRFCSPLPHQVVDDEKPLGRLSRYLVALWYVMEFLLAAIGVWRWGERRGERGEGTDGLASPPSAFRLPPSPWLWGLLLIAGLLAPHAVYGTDMRMRGPVMPVVALAAATGAIGLVRRIRQQDV